MPGLNDDEWEPFEFELRRPEWFRQRNRVGDLAGATQSASTVASRTVASASTSTASRAPKIKVEVVGSQAGKSPTRGTGPLNGFSGVTNTS